MNIRHFRICRFFDSIVKILNKNIILEFDDAIYLTHPKKMPKLIKMCKSVIVGNSFLKNYAVNYNQNLVVVPTVIDIRRYSINPLTLSLSRKGEGNKSNISRSPSLDGRGHG